MIIFYLIFRFIFADGFNLVTNLVVGTYCSAQTAKQCNHKIYNQMSKANLRDNEYFLLIQDILNLVVVVISILFFFCYRKKQYHIARVLDENEQTEDDYAILVTNIPLIDFPTKKDTKRLRAKDPENMELFHREHIENFF